MAIRVTTDAFDPWAEVRGYQESLDGCRGKFGGTAMFVGSMRDFNQGDEVHEMTLEHYPGMTESYLGKILQRARETWEILDALIIHRVGTLHPGDPIVLVAVWSAHRAAAFDACRFIMEALKSDAPFWKKEILEGTSRWVEGNTPG